MILLNVIKWHILSIFIFSNLFLFVSCVEFVHTAREVLQLNGLQDRSNSLKAKSLSFQKSVLEPVSMTCALLLQKTQNKFRRFNENNSSSIPLTCNNELEVFSSLLLENIIKNINLTQFYGCNCWIFYRGYRFSLASKCLVRDRFFKRMNLFDLLVFSL